MVKLLTAAITSVLAGKVNTKEIITKLCTKKKKARGITINASHVGMKLQQDTTLT